MRGGDEGRRRGEKVREEVRRDGEKRGESTREREEEEMREEKRREGRRWGVVGMKGERWRGGRRRREEGRRLEGRQVCKVRQQQFSLRFLYFQNKSLNKSGMFNVRNVIKCDKALF